MKSVTYVLRVMVPDHPEHDESGVWDEILEESDAQDMTVEAKIRRYLGGALGNVERAFSDDLPEGWYARIEDAS